MGREIRITIDDDEVFERMKARKRELDLSWKEVLHRGLRRHDPVEPSEHRRGVEPPEHRHGFETEPHGQPYRDPPPDPIRNPRGFADDLKRQIQGQVRESLHASLEPNDWGGSLETDVDTLESAEDAVLVFDFLGEDAHERAYQVPLRVTLEASASGLEVTVVTVREGKTVTDMNAFDPAIRRRIIERLATGDVATLRLGEGAEGYSVEPILSWSRNNGVPTVTTVRIEEVHFDAE